MKIEFGLLKNMKKKKRSKQIEHEIKTSYLGRIYGKEFLKVIPAAIKKLKALRKRNYFDAIAVTGTSGMGIGFPISFLLKIPIINVRKPCSSHYDSDIEGTISSKRYLIIDDVIASGRTINSIREIIRRELSGKAKAVGILLYDSKRRSRYKNLPVYTLSI